MTLLFCDLYKFSVQAAIRLVLHETALHELLKSSRWQMAPKFCKIQCVITLDSAATNKDLCHIAVKRRHYLVADAIKGPCIEVLQLLSFRQHFMP